MNLINSESLDQIKGGEMGHCNKTGDTIICFKKEKIYACLNGELNCEGEFSSSCNILGVTISGCDKVTITPKP